MEDKTESDRIYKSAGLESTVSRDIYSRSMVSRQGGRERVWDWDDGGGTKSGSRVLEKLLAPQLCIITTGFWLRFGTCEGSQFSPFRRQTMGKRRWLIAKPHKQCASLPRQMAAQIT